MDLLPPAHAQLVLSMRTELPAERVRTETAWAHYQQSTRMQPQLWRAAVLADTQPAQAAGLRGNFL
jgi:hypothetical protein